MNTENAGRRRRGMRLFTFMVIICALTVTAVWAAAGVSKAQPLAASGPACNSSFNPYRYALAQIRACGYAIYPVLATVDMPGGGSAVEYKMKNAMVRNLIPPPGFRPESASAAALDEYGFPARPAQAARLSLWRREMSRWRSAVPPTPYLAETKTRVTADTESSYNWAGYVISAPSGGSSSFSQAEAWYYEPTIAAGSCSPASEVTWAGLGGWSGDTLVQGGTAWNSSGVDAHEAWWEIVPFNNLTPLNYYATPGQEFDASVTATGSGYSFWFLNYATGQSDAFDVAYPGAGNGLSAEVVVERPTIGTSLADLADFQTLQVAQSQAWLNGSADGETFDTFPPQADPATGLWRHGVHMESTAGTDLADPSGIQAGGAFQVTQHSCG
ncbi:MAG: hypothetical protein JO132_09675 [Streptosporangiaceae bacterium]|nr:hypothetical protein [Streptosporangiaceae bacterium]